MCVFNLCCNNIYIIYIISRVLDYDSSLNKYLEVHFKLLMTVNIMMYGIYVVVIRDSAFYHAETQYTGENDYPPQHYDNWMLFYYWLSLGYHVHRCAFQFFNHARKDFWAMFIHHWTTIALISISWVAGFCQTGVLVMFLHDNGDVWLPLAKVLFCFCFVYNVVLVSFVCTAAYHIVFCFVLFYLILFFSYSVIMDG